MGGLYILFRGDYKDKLEEIKNQLGDRKIEKYIHPKIPEEINLYSISQTEEMTVQMIRKQASRNSCVQSIANDCSVVFSLLAPIDESMELQPRSYAHLHWECGFLGQLLYVQAYYQQIHATGMGCFIDKSTAKIFNVTSLKPLYHFAIGIGERETRFSVLHHPKNYYS